MGHFRMIYEGTAYAPDIESYSLSLNAADGRWRGQEPGDTVGLTLSVQGRPFTYDGPEDEDEHLAIAPNVDTQWLEVPTRLFAGRDLSSLGGLDLAYEGPRAVNPLTGERAISAANVKYLLSIMLSCGMYDFAGEWAFRVGLPAKSGVGGGIVAVVPGVLGIGVYSPKLDAKGNSVRGVRTCSELSERFGLHCFESQFTGPDLRDQLALRGKPN